MAKIQLIDKINTIVIIKISLLISLIIEFALLYLNSLIEGNIKYFGFFFFILLTILTIFCDKDLIFKSLKNPRKIIIIKNSYILLLIFIIIYYPISFYKNYINLKDSYTFSLFIISIISTLIFHYILILALDIFIKKGKTDKENDNNEELIDEEIKKAMVNE